MSPLADGCAILISFILLSAQKSCNVHPHHMHTFGAEVVLLDLNQVVWSPSDGYVRFFFERPDLFFPRGLMA